MSKQRLLLGSLGLVGAGGRKDEELQSRALQPLQVFCCKHLLKPEKGFFFSSQDQALQQTMGSFELQHQWISGQCNTLVVAIHRSLLWAGWNPKEETKLLHRTVKTPQTKQVREAKLQGKPPTETVFGHCFSCESRHGLCELPNLPDCCKTTGPVKPSLISLKLPLQENS